MIIILCSAVKSSHAQSLPLDPVYYKVFDQDSLIGFDETAARMDALSKNLFGSEFKVKMYIDKRNYINNKYNLIGPGTVLTLQQYLQQNRPAAVPGCVNEDFEASAAATINSPNQIAGWTVSGGFSGGANAPSNATSCNLLGCCPVGPSKSAIIDCSSPGGFIDPQIGSQYPIYSVFGSGAANFAAGAANPQINQSLFGNKVIRLNDGIANDNSMEKLSKTFAVTASNALFQFAFISVFAPNHGCCEAGAFQILLTNASANTVIPCPNFSVAAPGSQCTATVPVDYYVQNTNTLYNPSSNANLIYNKWKINSIDLSAYIGQNITIDIVVSDCIYGGHIGKIYFDAQCGPMVINGNGINFDAGIQNVVVPTCGAAGATICAAAGLGPYFWAGPGVTPNQATPSMSNQCITSTISATYTLFMMPQGACQPISRLVTSTITPAPLLAASAVQATCGNTIAAVSVTPAGSAASPSTLSWSPSPLTMATNSLSATYVIPVGPNSNPVFISATDPLGCLVTASVAIDPAPPYPTFTVVNMTNSYSITCLTPVINLDAQTTYNYNNGTLNYFWSSNSATFATSNVNVIVPGNYTVYALDPVTNCGVTHTVSIGVNTVAPTSTVTPLLQSITCSNAAIGQITACGNQTVNITHNILTPVGGTLVMPGTCVNYVPQGVGIHTVISVNDINGCSTLKTFTVTSNQGYPTFTLMSPQDYTLGCSSKSVAVVNIVNASATNSLQVPNGGAVTYTMVGPGTSSNYPPPVQGSLSANSTYTINIPGTWTVIVRDNVNGCDTKTPISILSNTFPPNAQAIVPMPTLTCFQPTTTLKGFSFTNNVNFAWSFPGVPGTQTGDTITVGMLASQPNKTVVAIYTLTVEDNSSKCINTLTVQIDQNIFRPKALISNGGNAGISCIVPTVQLTNVSTSGIPGGFSGAVASRWDGPTPQEPALFQTTYVGYTPGVYTLTAMETFNGCKSTATISIDDKRDFPKVTLKPTFVLDCGAPITSLTVEGKGNYAYDWSTEGGMFVPGTNTMQTLKTNGMGEFAVDVTDKTTGCLVQLTTTVIAGKLFVDFETEEYSGYAPLSINFINKSHSTLDTLGGPYNVKSIWNFGNGTTQTFSNTGNARVLYNQPGQYTVTLYGGKGACLASKSRIITVKMPSNLTVPTIFSPNGDKINDLFFLQTTSLTEIHMTIVDRWGHMIYQLDSQTGNMAWDGRNQSGTEVPDGVYYYTLKAKGEDGLEYDKAGTITLVR